MEDADHNEPDLVALWHSLTLWDALFSEAENDQ